MLAGCTRTRGDDPKAGEVSGSTGVYCYRSGVITTPQKRIQAVLTEETAPEWQPQVRAQARERAATSGGMWVECTACFGFAARGSSDGGR
ncbi:hypothetical protein [Streptomyces goshikiensis]|uniref:hypothetical protein n=1 Tax=Streptomyces goshikiensis TaxID=1942 RepID=UPI0036C22032